MEKALKAEVNELVSRGVSLALDTVALRDLKSENRTYRRTSLEASY